MTLHVEIWLLVLLPAVFVADVVLTAMMLRKLQSVTSEITRVRALAAEMDAAKPVTISWQEPPDHEPDEEGQIIGMMAVEGARISRIGRRHVIDLEDVVTIVEAMDGQNSPMREAVRMFRGLYGASLGRG